MTPARKLGVLYMIWSESKGGALFSLIYFDSAGGGAVCMFVVM